MSGSASELQWLIEDRRRRLEDVEEQLSSATDPDIIAGLKGMISMLNDEIADLEAELGESGGEDDIDSQIDDIDSKIRDINSQMELETDPVVRNNLEVSKRFLQMERNGLLIRQAQTTKRKSPEEEKIEELQNLCDSRLRFIQDLESRLKKAEKDLSYYKALADNPDRGLSCDLSRVTVTAESLSAMRNESKKLSLENYQLKEEIRKLRSELDMKGKNVVELTRHCKEADSEILRLQARVQELRKKMEDSE